jgi:muconolactone delta-isomerase
MVTISLPAFQTQEFMALIPKQRAMIVELLASGRLSSFCLGKNRDKAWLIASCKDQDALHNMLRKFPMHKFFEYEVTELVIYDTEFMGLPKMVLN